MIFFYLVGTDWIFKTVVIVQACLCQVLGRSHRSLTTPGLIKGKRYDVTGERGEPGLLAGVQQQRDVPC